MKPTENAAAVKEGCNNLARHIRNVKSFGMPVVVAVNRFTADTDAEVAAIGEGVEGLPDVGLAGAVVVQHEPPERVLLALGR